MYLDLDVGNTRVKWRVSKAGCAVASGAISTALWERCKFDFESLRVPALQFTGVRIASVLGGVVGGEIKKACYQSCRIEPSWAVVCRGQLVEPAYEDISRLGVDRWLAMLGAYSFCGSACVVVDAGSALTVDVVGKQGEHLGGYIVPGASSLSGALGGNTRDVRSAGCSSLALGFGQNTDACVNGGLNLMVHSFLQGAIRRAFDSVSMCPVYLAGGDADYISKLLGLKDVGSGVFELDGVEWVVKKDIVFSGLDVLFG